VSSVSFRFVLFLATRTPFLVLTFFLHCCKNYSVRTYSGKSYYVSFVYDANSKKNNNNSNKKQKATKKRANDGREGPSKKKQKTEQRSDDDDDDDASFSSSSPPDGKLPATTTEAKRLSSVAADKGPFSFELLPEAVQLHVVQYCDVPTLGSLVPVSKALCRLAKQDAVWEQHLRTALRVLFDEGPRSCRNGGGGRGDACGGGGERAVVVPLTLRPDWREPAALMRWYHECRSNDLVCGCVNDTTKHLFDLHVIFRPCTTLSDGYEFLLERFAWIAPAGVDGHSDCDCDCGCCQCCECDENPWETGGTSSSSSSPPMPLRDYYRHVVHFAYLSVTNTVTDKPDHPDRHQYCPDCFRTSFVPSRELARLPKIMYCFE